MTIGKLFKDRSGRVGLERARSTILMATIDYKLQCAIGGRVKR